MIDCYGSTSVSLALTVTSYAVEITFLACSRITAAPFQPSQRGTLSSIRPWFYEIKTGKRQV